MSPRPSAPPARRRGATRKPRGRRVDAACLDRWLDRLVTVAVLTALVVGGAALVVSLAL